METSELNPTSCFQSIFAKSYEILQITEIEKITKNTAKIKHHTSTILLRRGIFLIVEKQRSSNIYEKYQNCFAIALIRLRKKNVYAHVGTKWEYIQCTSSSLGNCFITTKNFGNPKIGAKKRTTCLESRRCTKTITKVHRWSKEMILSSVHENVELSFS